MIFECRGPDEDPLWRLESKDEASFAGSPKDINKIFDTLGLKPQDGSSTLLYAPRLWFFPYPYTPGTLVYGVACAFDRGILGLDIKDRRNELTSREAARECPLEREATAAECRFPAR
ncbi:hypothetical protein KM043_012768 [Ampulex compressa]|nr:hypothetical protein KM043_012768 [Ampulex compressa]